MKHFEFGPVVQDDMSFNIYFYLKLWGGPFVQRSGTIYVILVEGIIGIKSLKLF